MRELTIPDAQLPTWAYRRAAFSTLLLGRLLMVRSMTDGTAHVPFGRSWLDHPDHDVPEWSPFVPGESGFILIGTHDCFLDPFEQSRWLYGHRPTWFRLARLTDRLAGREPRPVRPQVAEAKMAKSALFGPGIGLLSIPARQIKVVRGDAQPAIDEAVERAAGGEVIWIAPVGGTVNPSFEVLPDGLPIKPGAFEIAQRTGLPLIPVAHWGTHRFPLGGAPRRRRRLTGLPARNWRFRMPVMTRFGAPIWVSPDAPFEDISAQMFDVLRDLQGQLIDEYPDAPAPEVRARTTWWPASRGGAAPDAETAKARHRAKRERQKAKSAAKRRRAG